MDLMLSECYSEVDLVRSYIYNTISSWYCGNNSTIAIPKIVPGVLEKYKLQEHNWEVNYIPALYIVVSFSLQAIWNYAEFFNQ